MLALICVGVLSVALVSLLRHLRRHRGSMDHLGIPVLPNPWSLGTGPVALHDVSWHELILERHRRHGMTFGRFEGTAPVISTIDPDLVKSIVVKNFDSFHGTFDFDVEDKLLTLDVCDGDKWRELRKALSPTFTSGKLKAMLEPMGGVADSLVEFLENERQKNDGTVNLRKCFEGLALDTIAQCAFGIKTDANNKPDQDIIKWGRESFTGMRVNSWFESLIFHFLFVFPKMAYYMPIMPPAMDHLRNLTSNLMEQQKKLDIKSDNFVARLTEILEQAKHSDVLTEDLVKAQGIVFFLAGFETTSNTLSTLFYNLAKNPEVQDNLYEEVKSVLAEHDGNINHETIGDMKYLDACIQEDLRLTGPVILHTRMCSKDCEVKPGFKILKGTRVDLNIHASHHWPDFFPEPDKFQPERFLKENADTIIPYTYRPFGGGSRVCIGQRFAMIEMKIAIAKLLVNYRVVATADTKLEFNKGDQFLLSYPEMKVKVERRS